MNLIRFSPISIYLFSDSVAFLMSNNESARAPFMVRTAFSWSGRRARILWNCRRKQCQWWWQENRGTYAASTTNQTSKTDKQTETRQERTRVKEGERQCDQQTEYCAQRMSLNLYAWKIIIKLQMIVKRQTQREAKLSRYSAAQRWARTAHTHDMSAIQCVSLANGEKTKARMNWIETD